MNKALLWLLRLVMYGPLAIALLYMLFYWMRNPELTQMQVWDAQWRVFLVGAVVSLLAAVVLGGGVSKEDRR